MARAPCRLLVWALVAYVLAAAGTTTEASAQATGAADLGGDERDVTFPDPSVPPKCCVPPRDYGSRTTFVPEMFRSVEEM